MKILLAEDETEWAAFMWKGLTSLGHEVTVARTGREALTLMEPPSPDLIVTDILMPEIDGFELLIALKKKAPDVPVIVISAGGHRASSTFYLETARSFGARFLLHKPFSISELEAAVRRATGDSVNT